MENDPTKHTVLRIVCGHFGIPAPAISLSDDIHDDLGADSLDRMELIMQVEEGCGVKITEKELSRILSIEDLVNAVKDAMEND